MISADRPMNAFTFNAAFANTDGLEAGFRALRQNKQRRLATTTPSSGPAHKFWAISGAERCA
eukprot:431665-Rhodomonas_salina.1